MNTSQGSFSSQTVRKPSSPADRTSSQAAKWLVGLAAWALVTVSIAGYLFHQFQTAAIASKHLRLIVIGPSMLQSGVTGRFDIKTSDVTGNPVSAPVEVSLYSPDGKLLLGRKESTDQQGRLQVDIPADMSLPSSVTIKVMAIHSGGREEASAHLIVERMRLVTQLSLDKPLYEPAETVYFRSLTVSRFGMAVERETSIQFEILSPNGTAVPNSLLSGTTEKGVGNGAFTIPQNLPGGLYTVLARSPDGSFPAEKKNFLIRRYRSLQLTGETTQSGPEKPGKIRVFFYPEGGQLAAGLENRVYFVCRDSQGKAVNLTGLIENEDAQAVAAVETIHDGMGQFSFTPRAGESYRLKIITPEDIEVESKLPSASSDCPIVLTTGTGVFGQSEPLEFNIRSSKADLPLVVGAWCRGVLVGQVARVAKNGMNPVVLSLPDDVAGVIRLTVFDYSVKNINIKGDSPVFVDTKTGTVPDTRTGTVPKPLAERLVYRHSSRRLNIRATDLHEHYAPGEKVSLSLQVTNEKNEPVAAALSISVVDAALLALAGDHTPGMPTRFLLNSEIDKSEELENADFYLFDGETSGTVPIFDSAKMGLSPLSQISPISAVVALDLLLGTQGWRQIIEKNTRQVAQQGTEKDQPSRTPATNENFSPPVMCDNLARIRAAYQHSLSEQYADQTRILYTIITISFLVALGLLLTVFMMGLLRIVGGAYFWLPILAATASCGIIGVLLTNPRQFTGGKNPVVPFLPYAFPAAESDRIDKGDSPIFVDAKIGTVPKKTPDGQSAETAVFAVRQYAHQHPTGQDGRARDFADALFWNPLIIASPDGIVPLSFDLSDSTTKFRLRANAHGAGRIGSVRLEISTENTEKQEEK